ncbi:nucleotidyltransferase family protein [Azospirillum sp.]|uniref:nucleotidyltransferase family protein n=1 Tax=Azospirillum sp. TaxID=34012 RepID=UPI002D431A70|nr:nucleotidyltransferase domain-containing protein [Azospirillum sp.]HYD66321.1 nucleotidyltransferase domain-containing protein [Azospirillum sp.]
MATRAAPPDLNSALARLRASEAELRAVGVRHAAVFGSVARGAARPGSDVDVLIEFSAGEEPDLFAYAGLRRRIAELLPGADVVERASLRPRLAPRILQEAVYAF